MNRPADRAAILDLRKEYDEFPLAWQFDRRRGYLKQEIESEVYEALLDLSLYRSYIARTSIVEQIIMKERIDGRIKRILSLQGEIIRMKDILKGKRPEITADMIERAREYPFTELYEFKRNMARCPFHHDRTPSLALSRDNMVRCFGACNASWDTIAFIRALEGLSFPEAVRRLQ